jgi:hypothetical protein
MRGLIGHEERKRRTANRQIQLRANCAGKGISPGLRGVNPKGKKLHHEGAKDMTLRIIEAGLTRYERFIKSSVQ